MALSRLAQEMAAEIRQHDWSDAPWRLDRAGHSRDRDSNRGGKTFDTQKETDTVRANVMLVTAQVLGHADPNFDIYEYAAACGVVVAGGPRSGAFPAGLRIDWTNSNDARYCYPGTWETGTGTYIKR